MDVVCVCQNVKTAMAHVYYKVPTDKANFPSTLF